VNVVEDYSPEELTELLLAIRPDLVLLLSQVPESYSYTLSEAFAHSIPVCAPNRGSFGERVVHGSTGFLLENDDNGLLELLVDLDSKREWLQGISRNIKQIHIRSVGDMLQDYYKLDEE
jgi:glycosyltransferase involved in cell wall biosynthesis